MSDYPDLFKVDDVPTTQSTNTSGKKPGLKLPPNHPLNTNNQQVQEQTIPQQTYTQPHKNTYMIFVLGILGVLLIGYLLYSPSTDKKSDKTDINSSLEINPTMGDVPMGNTSSDNFLQSEATVTQEMIWVNYEKVIYRNNAGMVNYTLECESPTHGDFVVIISKAEFKELAIGGVIPLIVNKNETLSDTYYDGFKLHPKWKELLNGNV